MRKKEYVQLFILKQLLEFSLPVNNANQSFEFIFQFPITALREIRILQLLKHENVVNLIEICRTKGNGLKETPVVVFLLPLYFLYFTLQIVLPHI